MSLGSAVADMAISRGLLGSAMILQCWSLPSAERFQWKTAGTLEEGRRRKVSF